MSVQPTHSIVLIFDVSFPLRHPLCNLENEEPWRGIASKLHCEVASLQSSMTRLGVKHFPGWQLSPETVHQCETIFLALPRNPASWRI